MRRSVVLLVLGVAAAFPAQAGAQGAVVFTSARCDQGGVPFSGSGVTGVCTPGVFVVNDDGTDIRRLTTGGFPGEQHRSGDFSPSWSHDGGHVAFERQTNEGHGLIRLLVMRANGSGVRRLIPDSPVDDERNAAWSPKADLIAFTGRQPNTPLQRTWVVRSDGSGLKRISPANWMTQSPTFMPDGSGVAFVAQRPIPRSFASENEVWMTDTRGRNLRRLTAGDIPIATNSVNFSPGGKYLAVTLYNGSLYTLRTDGGELTRLTKGVSLDPDWSATGDAIYYRGGGSTMGAVIKRLGFPVVGPARSLTAPGVSDSSPEWSLPGRVTAAAPVEDESPPLVLLPDTIAEPATDLSESDEAPESSRRISAAQLPPPAMSKIPFLVMDRSGIRTIEIGAGLRVGGRCRFLQPSRKLGPRRPCAHPTYVRVSGGQAWKSLTAKLPKGKYQVRFRTVDLEGNVVRRPKPHSVTVK